MKRLNPAVKFVCLMVLTFVLAFRHQPILNFAFFALCIVGILSSGTDVKKLLILLSPILLAAVGMFFTGYRFSAGEGMPVNSGDMILTGSHVWNGLIHASRVLAFAGGGCLYCLTTDRVLMIRSFQRQFHLPQIFAYGLLAAWGVFPPHDAGVPPHPGGLPRPGQEPVPRVPGLFKAAAGQVRPLVGGAGRGHGVQGL